MTCFSQYLDSEAVQAVESANHPTGVQNTTFGTAREVCRRGLALVGASAAGVVSGRWAHAPTSAVPALMRIFARATGHIY